MLPVQVPGNPALDSLLSTLGLQIEGPLVLREILLVVDVDLRIFRD